MQNHYHEVLYYDASQNLVFFHFLVHQFTFRRFSHIRHTNTFTYEWSRKNRND